MLMNTDFKQQSTVLLPSTLSCLDTQCCTTLESKQMDENGDDDSLPEYFFFFFGGGGQGVKLLSKERHIEENLILELHCAIYFLGEQGWQDIPPLCPRFNSQTWVHM